MKIELTAAGNETVEFEFEPKGQSVRIFIYVSNSGEPSRRILRTVSQKEFKAMLKSL